MSINVKVTETPNVDLTISSSTGLNVGVGGTSHNSLIGLQGGTTGEYYHLTAAEYSALSLSADDYVNITGAETISGVKTFASGLIIAADTEDIVLTGNLIDGDRKLFIDAESLIVGNVNSVNSLYSAVILGSGNNIYGDYDVIAGGTRNTITGDNYSIIIGGDFNTIEGGDLGYNTINGGTSHSITNSTASLVDGGYDNDILGASNAVIVGGQSNRITSGTIAPDHSIVLGGESNVIINATNSIVVGGVSNYASGSFSTVVAGRQGRAIHDGATVLADGQARQKNSVSDHSLTIDFASGVTMPTGNLAVTQDITMGGETVATRTWVQDRELGQRFDTALTSGIDEIGITFSTSFSEAPMVQCELQLPDGGERTYFTAVRNVTTTGFFVEFSDNIGAGYTLQTRAIPNT